MSTRMQALRHPVRQKIIEHLRLGRVASVSELATLLHEASSYVSYHVDALLAAGLIRVIGKRTANHRAERVFELAEDEIKLATPGSREEAAEELYSFAKRSLSQARKDLEECSQRPEIEDVHFYRWVFSVNDESRKLIEEGLSLLRKAAELSSGDSSFSLTLALVPLQRAKE